MPVISTEELAEDIDSAIRDAYQAIRVALNRVEDLKITRIGKVDIKSPFAPEHDEMYSMYLNLSKRFQEMREEVHGHGGPAQTRPPTPGPTPHADKPSTGEPPPQRGKSRPYALIPPRSPVLPAPPLNNSTSQRKQTATTKENRPLKGKRKAGEPKDVEPSNSKSEQEDCLPTKRMKTRDNHDQVDDRDAMVDEDSDGWGSCLFPSLPLSPETSEALCPKSPVPPKVSETDHQAQWPEADVEKPSQKPSPDPDTKPVPVLIGPPTASRPRDVKLPISADKKYKLTGKKKSGTESQFTMDDALRDKRLLAVGPDFEVDNDRITHQQVGPNSRATMSQIFGGNPQRTFSYPSAEKRRMHGFTNPLLFPTQRLNPLLPTKLGERGLLFRLDQKLEQWVDNEGGVGPYHLMMHHTPNDYCYFGVYEFVRVDLLTKGEWLAQSSETKDKWVNFALKAITGEQTRARVLLRRELGREPTKAEVDAIKKDVSLKTQVTLAQVMEDFNSGKEQMVAWGMKCTGYNYEFEEYLADNLAAANALIKEKLSE